MVRVCALGLSLLLASSTAFAQVSSTTGSINGKVTDSSGGVLPGVTVTASSPSMQGIRTDVTNEAGEYRFPAVPPGTYKLVYELGGFGTVNREGVSVGLGFTATMNIELAVASLQETVTVSGESPVVDVSTTTTASNFGEERLAALPNARDFWTVLAASPAMVVTRIDVGGSAAGTQTGYAVYDTKEDQHRPMVEGIVNTEGTNAAGFYYDYGSIDEVAVADQGPHRRDAVAGRVVELRVQVGRQRVPRQDLRRLPEQGGAEREHRRRASRSCAPAAAAAT